MCGEELDIYRSPNAPSFALVGKEAFTHIFTCSIHSYPHLIPTLGVKRVKTDIFSPAELNLCLLLNPCSELVDLVIDRTALSHKFADLSVGMHHCCVIAAAKCLANLR